MIVITYTDLHTAITVIWVKIKSKTGMRQNQLQFIFLSLFFILIALITSIALNQVFEYSIIVLFSSFVTVIALVLSIYQIVYVNTVIKQRYVAEDPELIGKILQLMKDMSETNTKYVEKQREEQLNELDELSEKVDETIDTLTIQSDEEYEEVEDTLEEMEERRKKFEEKMGIDYNNSDKDK